MKAIIPIAVTDAVLTDTNVHETAPAIYAGGTTYGLGDFAHVVNGIALDIYESLQAANTGKNPVTETDWWVFRSTTYPEYSAGTTYAEDEIVIVAADHRKYVSLDSGNTGNTPVGGVTDIWWSVSAATAPWAPFDKKIGMRVERSGTIEYEITPAGIVAGIAFFKLDAASVDIVMTDPVEGVVYTNSINLISDSNVFDAYSHRFAPFLLTRHTVVVDIPPYISGVISITINAESNTAIAKCGEIVFGALQYSGASQYSPTLEILNYTTIIPDVWGNLEVVERSFSNKVNVEMVLANSIIQSALDFFENYRAIPVVWIPVENGVTVGPMLTYGYYKTMSVVFSYPEYSVVNVELIGMVMT